MCLEQSHLVNLRPSEQIGAQRHSSAGESSPFPCLLEAGADQVGPHSLSPHPAAEVGVVVATAPYVANDRHHLGRAAGIMFLQPRSEEHTSELQSLMRISYAVFRLKKQKT